MSGPLGAGEGVLVLAGGARWEAEVISGLPAAGYAVVRRCVDVPDLMAAAQTGSARVAVVDAGVGGLDGEVVLHLLRHDVRLLAIAGDPAAALRAERIGAAATTSTGADDLATAVVDGIGRMLRSPLVEDPDPAPEAVSPPEGGGRGRLVVVWGPTGAPGRTTVAIGLATTHAAERDTVLVDADPYGGAVAQHLGVLDEVSGLLATARLANAGLLDADAFGPAARRLGGRLVLLSGLPRPDRRVEVRPGALDRVLEVAREYGDVVVDVGFCLEDHDLEAVSRDQMTLEALAVADAAVVVGGAEPTGLARLARALVELPQVPGPPESAVHVVVNRMRPTLGWGEQDIVGMIEGYLRPAGVHFLPEDRASVDRALVTGRSIGELGDSALQRALVELAGSVLGGRVAQPPRSR